MSELTAYIRPELFQKFEFQNYGHALEILTGAFPNEWNEIQDCLAQLNISIADLQAAGGNETAIPKKTVGALFWPLEFGNLAWRGIQHDANRVERNP